MRSAITFLLSKLDHGIIVTMMEIYGDKVFDLISDNEKKQIDKSVRQALATATKKEIHTSEDFDVCLSTAIKRRIHKRTNENATSSRSHAIIIIQSQKSDSKLTFVDLAGFEYSPGKENLQETCHINLALLEVNRILLKLSKGEKPICRGNTLIEFLDTFLKHNLVIFFHVHSEHVKKSMEYVKDLLVSISVTQKQPLKQALKDISCHKMYNSIRA